MKWSTFGKALWIGTKVAYKAAVIAAQAGVIKGKAGAVLSASAQQSRILKSIEDEARIRRVVGR